MDFANSFMDLEVYRLSRQVCKEVYILSKNFPIDERFSLTDQIRRSSRSVGAQISEAWGKRKYEAHFISKLTDADSEQLETQHWIDVAEESGYIKEIDKIRLMENCRKVGKMLQMMINKADSFCRK